MGLIEATERESDKVVKDKIKTAQLVTVMVFLRLLIEFLLIASGYYSELTVTVT